MDFVRRGAEARAQRIVEFFRLGGLSPDDFDPRVPIAVGTVTQLRDWDRAGWRFHHALGLPSWQDALAELVAAIQVAETDPSRLDAFRRIDLAVFRVWLERFAWVGPTELQAEVALDVPDEDRLVDALAAFLWANRRSRSGGARPPRSTRPGPGPVGRPRGPDMANLDHPGRVVPVGSRGTGNRAEPLSWPTDLRKTNPRGRPELDFCPFPEGRTVEKAGILDLWSLSQPPLGRGVFKKSLPNWQKSQETWPFQPRKNGKSRAEWPFRRPSWHHLPTRVPPGSHLAAPGWFCSQRPRGRRSHRAATDTVPNSSTGSVGITVT